MLGEEIWWDQNHEQWPVRMSQKEESILKGIRPRGKSRTRKETARGKRLCQNIIILYVSVSIHVCLELGKLLPQTVVEIPDNTHSKQSLCVCTIINSYSKLTSCCSKSMVKKNV